ncbi:unnamed protein product [Echinostoma caproni]|uniref:DUF3558 domain-containing protein n=1 Tax=Echinostoma caproni TaxID=27848 RepID=A0A183B419_9TREM|nr:unnamed protein product [Echinostoma caproni]
MRSPLRPRNLGLLAFVGVCTIVFFTLRRGLEFGSTENSPLVEGILLSESEFDTAADDNAMVQIPPEQPRSSPPEQPRSSMDQCYQVTPLTCVFDSKASPGCYLINNVEPVVPLGLIRTQYEVSGRASSGDCFRLTPIIQVLNYF